MEISVDPEAVIGLIGQAEQELNDLQENFEACDLGTFYSAAALEPGAPAVADSVRDVAAREGANRTKPMAQAREATKTLRGTIDDWIRFDLWAAGELEEIGKGLLSEAEKIAVGTVHGFEDLAEGALHTGETLAEGALHTGETLAEGALHTGETLAEGALHAGEKAVDGLASGAKKVFKAIHL